MDGLQAKSGKKDSLQHLKLKEVIIQDLKANEARSDKHLRNLTHQHFANKAVGI
jgi:hypothetical protein